MKELKQVETFRRILTNAETELRTSEAFYKAVLDASVVEDGDHMEKIAAASSAREKAREKQMLAAALLLAAESVHAKALISKNSNFNSEQAREVRQRLRLIELAEQRIKKFSRALGEAKRLRSDLIPKKQQSKSVALAEYFAVTQSPVDPFQP